MMISISVIVTFVIISPGKCSYYDDLMMQDLYKRLSNNYDTDELSYQKFPYYNQQIPLEDYSKDYYQMNENDRNNQIHMGSEDVLNNDAKEISSDDLSNINQNDIDNLDADIRGDSEYIRHGPSKWGFQYISGGAGEGEQKLTPDGKQPNVQEVKSDESLPFYCHPPNPCPRGYTAADGCDEGVEDTAEAQKNYIHNLMKTGQCTCDREHMFECPSDEDVDQHMDSLNSDDELDDIMSVLSHKNYPYNEEQDKQYVVAKKSPESDSYENLVDPAKISSGSHNGNDMILKRVAKKGFPGP